MSEQSECLGDAGLSERRVEVWDRFVRVFHWSVALAFFIAYFIEDELLAVHVWAGYIIGVLVAMRIVWGFAGPKHARFRDFVCGPWKAWRYVLDLISFRAERHVGHSPAGGVMVILLFAGLLATVWSGMELHAIENDAGPLATITQPMSSEPTPSWSSPIAIVPTARAVDDERHEGKFGSESEDLWEDIHELMANLVMTLVVLHIIGVVLASVVHRENLVRSMLTGSKREP